MHRSSHKAEIALRISAWKRWLPLVPVTVDGATRLRIRWRRLIASFTAVLLLGYLALATGAFLFVKYERGFANVAWLDLAWPGRWSRYRVANGDHLIALAESQLTSGDGRTGFANLRAGVAKSPANRRGRLLLHDVLIASRRPDLAERVLIDGLPFLQFDAEYLRLLFGLLLNDQQDAQVRDIAGKILDQPDAPVGARQVAALAAASASYFRGNYDQSEALLEQEKLATSFDGRLLTAQVEWDRGYHDLALEELRALADEFPNSEPCLIQLGAWLRETGAHDEYRRLCLLRRIAHPDDFAPRVAFLYALHEDGNAAELAGEIAAILHDFARNENALASLAEFAANTGDIALARRVYDHCRAQRLSWDAPAFLLVESHIVARQYRAALDLARQLLDSNPTWAKRYYTLFNSLQAIAYFGLHDDASARLYLENFLGQTDLRADNLIAVAQRFVDVGAPDEARLTLEHAVQTDPRNQAALTRLVSLEVEQHDLARLPGDLLRLTAMRKPSAEVLQSATKTLASDLFLFSPQRDAALTAAEALLARSGPNRRS